MCVHDLDHDLKYSVFKVIVYVKYEFKFFLVFKFLTGRWSVGRWSVHLIGGRLAGDRWSVGRLVGDFKETQLSLYY